MKVRVSVSGRWLSHILAFAVLWGFVLVLLVRFGVPVSSDGLYYYVYLPSIVLDGDLDLANDYEAIGNPYKICRTETGRMGNPFQVGAAILWLPFYLIGHLIAGLGGGSGIAPGYGRVEFWSVAIGSAFYGSGSIFLVYWMARRWFGVGIALLGAFGISLGSFFIYYVAAEASFAHAPSAFAVSAFLAVWWSARESRKPLVWLGLGVLLGLAGSVRAQNLLFVVVPMLWGVAGLGRAWSPARMKNWGPRGLAMVLGVLTGFLPQMVVWWILYGSPLVIPQGGSFMRWTAPSLSEVLFSTRHGLFCQTPITFLAIVGLFAFWGRAGRLGAILLVALAVQWYINAAVSDWWAGASYGMRRFSGSILILGIGLAAFLDLLSRVLDRHRRVVRGVLLGGIVLFFVYLNIEGIRLYRQDKIPGSATWSVADALRGTAVKRFGQVYRRVGNPFSFPANWIFARKYGVRPDRYDEVVGSYFAYDHPFPGYRLNVGRAEYDPYLIGSFFDLRSNSGSPSTRVIRGSGRFLVPLYEKRSYRLVFRLAPCLDSSSAGPEVRVDFNGDRVTTLTLKEGWSEYQAIIGPEVVKIGVNELTLHSDGKLDVPFKVQASSVTHRDLIHPREKQYTGSHIRIEPISAGNPQEFRYSEWGIHLVIVDPDSGEQWGTGSFDTSARAWIWQDLCTFVDGIPPGHYVIGVVNGDAGLNFTYPALEALRTMAMGVDLRGEMNRPFAFAGRKGRPPGTGVEVFPGGRNATLQLEPGEPLPIAIDWIDFLPLEEE